MEQEMIPLEDFCHYYEIEVSFVQSLEDSGLVDISRVERNTFISFDEMPRVEKFIRMHYDLNINVEGLETIDYLLKKMEALQDELIQLRNRFEVEG